MLLKCQVTRWHGHDVSDHFMKHSNHETAVDYIWNPDSSTDRTPGLRCQVKDRDSSPDPNSTPLHLREAVWGVVAWANKPVLTSALTRAQWNIVHRAASRDDTERYWGHTQRTQGSQLAVEHLNRTPWHTLTLCLPPPSITSENLRSEEHTSELQSR